MGIKEKKRITEKKCGFVTRWMPCPEAGESGEAEWRENLGWPGAEFSQGHDEFESPSTQRAG